MVPPGALHAIVMAVIMLMLIFSYLTWKDCPLYSNRSKKLGPMLIKKLEPILAAATEPKKNWPMLIKKLAPDLAKSQFFLRKTGNRC